MTAVSASQAGARGPRVAFFWWLSRNRSGQFADAIDADSDAGYVVSDADYIPTGTADLWRRGRVTHTV